MVRVGEGDVLFGGVEDLFKSNFGTTVQIKSGGKLVDNKTSLGDARRAAEG